MIHTEQKCSAVLLIGIFNVDVIIQSHKVMAAVGKV